MPYGRRRGRRRRRFRKRIHLLEPALLLLLHHAPAHGYALLEGLKDLGVGDMDASIVYRVLRDMEGRRWVESSWDDVATQGPPRRIYRLTAEGDRALAQYIAHLTESRKRIDHFLDAYRRHMEEGEGEHH